MVNNINKIRPLLNWRSKDDFYFLQILQRKKDFKDIKVNGCNNNSRAIKFYYIKSHEHFDFIMPEVIQLCEIFGARASINLNRRSFRQCALQHLRKVTDQIINEDYDKAHKAYSTVVGSYIKENDKRWILDIDDKAIRYFDVMDEVNKCNPIGVDKFVAKLPSLNGYHLITQPFDLKKFKEAMPDIEIHKNNPTNLYIP